MGALPVLAVIDCAIVIGMAMLWARSDNMRAYSIGGIGLLKCGWTLLAYSVDPLLGWPAYAVALGGASLLQILIARGYANAMGHRLDDLCRRVAPRRYRLLRHAGR